MKRKINSLSVSYMLFLILLFLSASIDGIWSNAVYFLAFILPFCLSMLEIKNEKKDKLEYLRLNGDGVRLTLLAVSPTIVIILLLSALTSLIISAVSGAQNSVDIGNSLPQALLSHALIPALLEEMLFRYLPLKLLAGHSKRITVLISALFFALIHHSFFSIPYAFVAGLIFMLVDVMCESVWPSVILHLLNNTASVLLIIYSADKLFTTVFLSALGFCATVSLIFFILNRKKHISALRKSLATGEQMGFNLNVTIFSAFAIFIAIICSL